jgi:hypothetical protein
MAFGDAQIKFARGAADQAHDAVLGFLSDKVGKSAGVYSVANTAATVVLGVIFTIGSQVAALFLETLGEVRNDNQGALNPVMAAALGDLLGVEISADNIPQGGGGANNIPRMRAIGGLLHDLLKSEFGGNGTPESVDGAAAARAFTGFNINFSAGSAIISILGEMSSLGYFKEFREVGESVAENLGLGRLHRGALKPLVDTLVTKPYDRQLLAQYRQTRMTPQQYTDASEGGGLDSQAWHDHLAEAGYTDVDITILRDLLRKNHSAGDLNALVRYGLVTEDQAESILASKGWSPAKATEQMRVQALARVDTLQDAYIHEAFNLARDRHMSEADFQQQLDSTKLTEEEKQLWSQRLSIHLLHPGKRVSILQLVYLGEHNQITDTEVDAWVDAEGYTAEDAALIHLYVLGKELDFDHTQQLKVVKTLQAKARALKAKAAAADKAAAAADKALAGATDETLPALQAADDRAHAAADAAHLTYDQAQAAADAAANQAG